MTPKEMEQRLLALQQTYAKAPADQQPRLRREYIEAHRQWLAARSQMRLTDV